jgi:hypothetical protein
VQALAGEKRAKRLGESERERKLQDTCVKRYTRRKVIGDCFSRAFKKKDSVTRLLKISTKAQFEGL